MAGGMNHGIGNSCRGRTLPALSGSEIGLTRPINDVHLDAAENLFEPQNRIACPIAAFNPHAVEGDLLEQGPTRGLHNRAFDLVFDAVRIDRLPAVVSRYRAAQTNAARISVDLEIERNRHIGGQVFVLSECKTATVIWTGLAPSLPAETFRDGRNDVLSALIV